MGWLGTRNHQEAVVNEAQEKSLLGADDTTGTLTRRLLVNASGRLLVDTENPTAVFNADGSMATGPLDGAYTFIYDADGRMIRIDKVVGSETWQKTYTYNSEDLLGTESPWTLA